MRIERLVTMANEIASFFAAAESAAQAPRATAYHLERFWTPAMRKQLADYRQHDGAGLSEVAAAAATLLAAPASD